MAEFEETIGLQFANIIINQVMYIPGRSVELEEEQLQEYQRLKHTATTNAFQYQQELESIMRKAGSKRNHLDNIQFQISEIETQVRLKAEELSVQEKRNNDLAQKIKDTETCLQNKERQKKV